MTDHKYNSRLKAAIKESGRLQYWIARKAGVTEFNLSQFINGHQQADTEEKRAIAKAIGRRAADIF